MSYAVSDIITSVNNLVDDTINPGTIVGWINDCLAEISTQVNAVLPGADVTQTSESLVIPEMWQRRLVIPYVAAKAKQQDSSQFEYSDLYNEFYGKLDDFINRYVPPLQYKILDVGQAITINGVAYTTVYGDTLGALASTNNVADFNSIITENTANGITITYFSNAYEADYESNPPYLYGGW